jgi:hypothetical protein
MRKLPTLPLVVGLITASIPGFAQSVYFSAGYKGASGISSAGGSATAKYPALDLQFATSDLVSISLGIGSLSYDYTSSGSYSEYSENGKGNALSLDVKFYPAKNRLQGFYVGPGIGSVNLKVDWTDKAGNSVLRKGTYSGTGTEVHCKLGYAIPVGPVNIDPNLQVGYFVAMPSNTSGKTSTMSLYLLLGLNIGFRF